MKEFLIVSRLAGNQRRGQLSPRQKVRRSSSQTLSKCAFTAQTVSDELRIPDEFPRSLGQCTLPECVLTPRTVSGEAALASSNELERLHHFDDTASKEGARALVCVMGCVQWAAPTL
jgi:hypothetical protein